MLMGKLFQVRCPECGCEFTQFNGIGVRDLAEHGSAQADGMSGATDPHRVHKRFSDYDHFYCPECNHEFDPNSKGFGYCLISEGLWD